MRGRRTSWRWRIAIAVVVLVLAVGVVRTTLVESFTVPSGSMEPTIEPGDRILADRLVRGSDLRRGDIVVFDGRHAFLDEVDPQGPAAVGRAVSQFLGFGGADYVKRVIGLPGDRVVCCDATGRITVNGRASDEPYIFPGDAPSETTYDVVVTPGHLWVMGDHRSVSSDSRAYLGRPGGGMVPLDDVIGQVTVRYWPPGRWGSLGAPGG